MQLVDANVLLYAVNEDAEHHEAARRWLDDALSGESTVGFAWVVLLAFVRLSTNPAIFEHPLALDEAVVRVEAWLGATPAVVLEPGPRHLTRLRELLGSAGAGRNLVTDAHLAALAVEHRATVVTFDRDFERFAEVRVVRPG